MARDLQNKVILITGATDGIGKAAAKEFALRGSTLTIIGRNPEKTRKVLAELKESSGNENISAIICDLSRMSEVKRAAEEFKAKHDKLDVLVNNAGATFAKPTKGPDGYEITYALNVLAPFFLTTSLLDLIRNTPNARVISTSSSMQARGHIDVVKIAYSLEGAGYSAYANSKLADILFAKELQRRLETTTATSNCFDPGMVKTSFGGFGGLDQGFVINLVYKLAAPFAITPEKGADSLIWLATSPEAAKLKGELVYKRQVSKPNKQALDKKLASDLWELNEKLCAEAVEKEDAKESTEPEVTEAK